MIMKSKSVSFRIAKNGKQALRCPGISLEDIARISNIYNYGDIGSC